MSPELEMALMFNLTRDISDLNMTLSALNVSGSHQDMTLDLQSILDSSINNTFFESNSSLSGLNTTTTESTQSPSSTVNQQAPSSDAIIKLISQDMINIVNPSISFLGILSNILSLIITIKSGLDKTHNILLFFILLSGSLFLIGNINIVSMICSHRFVPREVKRDFCVHYKMIHAYAFYGTWLTMDYILAVAKIGVNIFPSFVIFEQLMAVFFPLKVRLVITPRRMLVACTSVYVMFAAFVLIYYLDKYEVISHTFYFTPTYNVTVSLVVAHKSHHIIEYIDWHIINNITGIVPIIIVSVGTMVILLEIVRQTAHRRSMTSSVKDRHSRVVAKATKTLLTLCILYCFVSLTQYLFGLVEIFDAASKVVVDLLRVINKLLVILYCSCNFVVSYLTNPTFRQVFKSMAKRLVPKSKPSTDREVDTQVTRAWAKSSSSFTRHSSQP